MNEKEEIGNWNITSINRNIILESDLIVKYEQDMRQRAVMELLSPSENELILDIGCGNARDLIVFANHDSTCIGIDFSGGMIKEGKKEIDKIGLKNIDLIIGDATNLPFKNVIFDKVSCSEMIEHIPNYEDTIIEMNRVLKIKGKLVITTPNWQSLYGLTRKLFGVAKLILRKKNMRYHAYDKWKTQKEVIDILERYGFEIKSKIGICFIPGFTAYMLPEILKKITVELSFIIENKVRNTLAGNGYSIGISAIKKKKNYKKVKEWNIIMHNIEADFYENQHPEIFNKIEMNLVHTFFKKIGYVHYILDVGTGTGFFTKIAIKHSKKVIAIDISMNMLIKCRSNFSNENIDFILADAENLPFKENIFDCVAASSVLHHIPEYKKFLSESFFVLKQGAVLYIQHEPNANVKNFALFSFFDKANSFIHRINRNIRNITDSDRRIKLIAKKKFSEKVLNQLKVDSMENVWLVTDIHDSRGFEKEIIRQILEKIGYCDIQQYSYNLIHPILYDIFPKLLSIEAIKPK